MCSITLRWTFVLLKLKKTNSSCYTLYFPWAAAPLEITLMRWLQLSIPLAFDARSTAYQRSLRSHWCNTDLLAAVTLTYSGWIVTECHTQSYLLCPRAEAERIGWKPFCLDTDHSTAHSQLRANLGYINSIINNNNNNNIYPVMQQPGRDGRRAVVARSNCSRIVLL